ncbi:hypothetical protein ABUW04_19160 [Streptacidiphilus sp. N1-10]|uniref:Uncharacterized protein n=1 Tax=Streptacidiphilus jeojiensis TaxID=3229225 RepID=A0ABV6XQZ0_9ACTN
MDTGTYPIGISVSHEYVKSLPITAHELHGTWKHPIVPTGPESQPTADGGQAESGCQRRWPIHA